LTASAGKLLSDSRTGKNTQHSVTALLRQSTYRRLAGYEDTNDAKRLSVDPTMRLVVGERVHEHHAASTSQMSRFETEILTQSNNVVSNEPAGQMGGLGPSTQTDSHADY